MYLRHLFSCYDAAIDNIQLKEFLDGSDWGWIKFFFYLSSGKYNKVTVVTYNYDIWLERILKVLGIPFGIDGFDSGDDKLIEIIKPHGSISFIPKGARTTTYAISYSLDFEGIPIDQLELTYDDLTHVERGVIIPPAGDSIRLETTAPWSQYLRNKAREMALEINENDEVVLCGISYWYVDRRELDTLLINLNQDVNFTFINPAPPRDLNAVLISIFKNYVQQSSSSEIGGILNG